MQAEIDPVLVTVNRLLHTARPLQGERPGTPFRPLVFVDPPLQVVGLRLVVSYVESAAPVCAERRGLPKALS
jgi:hypothetical protein